MLQNLIFIFLLSWSGIISAQDSGVSGLMSNPEFKILYRGYDNVMEMFTCSDCDSVFVSSADAKIIRKDEGLFYVNVGAGVRKVTLRVNCVKGADTSSLWAEAYTVKSLPKPTIYLGGVDVTKDFNHVADVDLFIQTRFSVGYDNSVPLKKCSYRAIKWTVKLGKEVFMNSDATITDAFMKAFIKARKGTKIILESVTVLSSDGFARRVQINQTYYKKDKRNTSYDMDAIKNRRTIREAGG